MTRKYRYFKCLRHGEEHCYYVTDLDITKGIWYYFKDDLPNRWKSISNYELTENSKFALTASKDFRELTDEEIFIKVL